MKYAISVVCWLLLGSTLTLAQDYSVAKIEDAPPAEEVAPEIIARLAPGGFKVVKGATRTVCEVWLAKEWAGVTEKSPGEVIYQLQPGQLIGVAKYPRKAADFRDQDIPSGVYTLRYGQQPIDGAHVGTSPTRDFVLLLPVAKDRNPAALEYKPLTVSSKEAIGTNHPAILSLQRPAATEALTLRHNEEKDWWIVRFTSKVKTGEKVQDLGIEMVVVGHADE